MPRVTGSTKDDGPYWNSSYTYTTSADMTTAAAVTASPTSGQKLCITDIFLSSDTQILYSFVQESDSVVLAAVRLPADGTVQLTPRTTFRLPTKDKKLLGKASAAGNVYVTAFYYSEP